ncbi:MAG TPA: tetratricopeptide repeat protein [Candidatus Methylacidiphilales bacterium]|nr:tetratricopeptide repeat protein [Candidatus Methylacidiphilales bacterium]
MAKRFAKKKGVNRDILAQVAGKTGVLPALFRSRHDWLFGLILMLAVILIYTPVWQAGYLWDDDINITANPCIVGPLGLKEIWSTRAADICPLAFTTFWLEHALWGVAPLPYHLVNVLLHGICAVLLWRVLTDLKIPGAWLGAALWALHPVQVESVAWITEMKNTESGLFFLLSVRFFTRYIETEDHHGQTDRWNYVWALLFAALAMASKSSTVILPGVFCLCAWWVEGRWQWRNLVKVSPVALMAIFPSALTLWTQKLGGGNDPQWTRTWPERLVTMGYEIWFYLGKLLWPYPVMAIYPRWQIDAGQWFSYLPLAVAIAVLFIFWFGRRSWARPWFFAWVYFLMALLPVLGLVNIYFQRYSFVADHFQYLASMGPLALAGAGLVRFFAWIIPGRLWQEAIFYTGLGLLSVLGILSWRQAWAYQSKEALWTDTLSKNRNCWVAHYNLGAVLSEKGEVDAAITQYEETLKLNPNYAEAHYNLGNSLLQKGQVDAAITQYEQAVAIDPNYAEAHANFGNALLQRGQMDEAAGQFQKALEIQPNFVLVHYDLGNVLAQMGRVDEAFIQFQKALELNPHFADVHDSLGNIFLQRGQIEKAIAEYQTALAIRPEYAGAHANLGAALLQNGQADEAAGQFQKALEVDPNFAPAHRGLGKILVQKGRWDEAIVQFQEALRLNPGNREVQNDLAQAQRMESNK